MNCRITNKPMEELFSLGELYVSNFVKNDSEYKNIQKSPLDMWLSKETQCLQLGAEVDPNVMYGKYWYRSGINNSMIAELKDIATKATKLSNSISLVSEWKSTFVDIASNDGTLLSFVNSENYYRIGIDPVEDSFHKVAEKNCDETIKAYFSKEAYESSTTYLWGKKKANIVTCIAMFYDLTDPVYFCKDVKDILTDDGLFIIQQSYMPLMLKQLAFDNICHEHLFYHSLYSMEYILKESGLKVVDVELNDVNGGSFRLYIQKENAPETSFGTKPYRDVAKMRLNSIRELEKTFTLDNNKIYKDFYNKIQELKETTFNFIKEKKEEGKNVWVYGASTKGNTLLQWYGLTNEYISGAAERSPFKYGLKTVGTAIPIYSEDIMRAEKPDYLLILPWHFINEFQKREKDYLQEGGQFIVPCPKFEIIKK